MISFYVAMVLETNISHLISWQWLFVGTQYALYLKLLLQDCQEPVSAVTFNSEDLKVVVYLGSCVNANSGVTDEIN